jgi:hypothetical protein
MYATSCCPPVLSGQRILFSATVAAKVAVSWCLVSHAVTRRARNSLRSGSVFTQPLCSFCYDCPLCSKFSTLSTLPILREWHTSQGVGCWTTSRECFLVTSMLWSTCLRLDGNCHLYSSGCRPSLTSHRCVEFLHGV